MVQSDNVNHSGESKKAGTFVYNTGSGDWIPRFSVDQNVEKVVQNRSNQEL